jgi:hypothetical protein
MRLEDVILRDVEASKPAAGDVPTGTLFAATDRGTLQRSNGTSWDTLVVHNGKRVVALTDAATVTPNAATTDIGVLATLSQATAFANPTGTFVDGQAFQLRITSATARALTWGTMYRGTTALPLLTATSGGNTTDVLLFQFNGAANKLDYLAQVLGFA